MAFLNEIFIKILLIFFSAFVLQRVIIYFNIANQSYNTALSIAAITGFVEYILGWLPFQHISKIAFVLSIMTACYMVMFFYETTIKDTLLIVFPWYMIYLIFALIILIFFGLISDTSRALLFYP